MCLQPRAPPVASNRQRGNACLAPTISPTCGAAHHGFLPARTPRRRCALRSLDNGLVRRATLVAISNDAHLDGLIVSDALPAGGTAATSFGAVVMLLPALTANVGMIGVLLVLGTVGVAQQQLRGLLLVLRALAFLHDHRERALAALKRLTHRLGISVEAVDIDRVAPAQLVTDTARRAIGVGSTSRHAFAVYHASPMSSTDALSHHSSRCTGSSDTRAAPRSASTRICNSRACCSLTACAPPTLCPPGP